MGKEMSAIDKVNGCMALLIQLCMTETNADTMTITTKGLTYNGKPLGSYELRIKKVEASDAS